MNTATTGSEEDANSKELCSTFDSGKMLFKMTASSCGQDEEDQIDDGRGRGRGHGPDPDNHVQSNMFLIHIVNFLLHYEPRDFITTFHATGLSTWTPDPVQYYYTSNNIRSACQLFLIRKTFRAIWILIK